MENTMNDQVTNQPKEEPTENLYGLGLFAGSRYYPLGGAKDFHGFRESIQETKELFEDVRAKNLDSEWDQTFWAQIVDLSTMEPILVCDDCESWHEPKDAE